MAWFGSACCCSPAVQCSLKDRLGHCTYCKVAMAELMLSNCMLLAGCSCMLAAAALHCTQSSLKDRLTICGVPLAALIMSIVHVVSCMHAELSCCVCMTCIVSAWYCRAANSNDSSLEDSLKNKLQQCDSCSEPMAELTVLD